MNKGDVRQGTTTDKRCERRKKGGKKASERRANARKESEGRVKEEKVEKVEKVERERKQQRKMVAPETARPHQNLYSDADGHDEMRDYPT